MDASLPLDNCSLGVLLASPRVSLDQLATFDDHSSLFPEHRDNATTLSFFRSRDDHHFVTLLYVTALHKC
jgi:hypothetical protein